MNTDRRGEDSCANLNHRRTSPPVRHCPGCGSIVNERVRAEACSEAHHDTERRQRSAYCAHCGEQLIGAT